MQDSYVYKGPWSRLEPLFLPPILWLFGSCLAIPPTQGAPKAADSHSANLEYDCPHVSFLGPLLHMTTSWLKSDTPSHGPRDQKSSGMCAPCRALWEPPPCLHDFC